ncbi:1-phosphofructokinase [Lederbergia citri]|uniref:Tagatose-6-phosphate kinase n=1 Tax=Lederbergia citri TaxID=2833580 RepID=A0A942TGN3_9BACI|nr:1-phosphofructokinase [Lederbergia citri]MBS4197711.1 1-phosphofructokinase [Lederbergia citri]
MIITITLNPAIDVSYQSHHFQLNKVQRVANGSKTAGGKGLNVSRVLKQLGCEPLCTGFLGGHSGSWIKSRLNQEGLDHSFIEINEETRTCLAIIDNQYGTQTELLEEGPFITIAEKDKFLSEFSKMLEKAKLITASGSLPKGIPLDIYSEISEMANASNVPFILDTSGKALEYGIQGRPFLIKPNKEELCQYVGKQELTMDEMIDAAKKICETGVQYVLVSLGKEGALLVGHDTVLLAEIPEIPVINPVGSGDSMLAGMAYALKNQYDFKTCLKWACACGMSNAMEAKTGEIHLHKVQELLTKIDVTVL